jgi:hypothetical protein
MLENTVVVDMHRLSPYDQGELWYGLGYSEDNFLEGTPSTPTCQYIGSIEHTRDA